jgi:hypothetical protein
MNMNDTNWHYIIELIIVFIFVYYFIKKEKPKLRFLFWGFLFSIIAFFVRLPLKLFVKWVSDNFVFEGVFVPLFLIIFLGIFLSEVTRYFSLKRYLKTKSYKNGILFGIGWAVFSSLIFLQSFVLLTLKDNGVLGSGFINYFFPVLDNSSFSLFSFIFLFVLNIAQSTLCVIAIIKKSIFYVFYAILLGIVVEFGFFYGFAGTIFNLGILLLMFFFIFHYRKIK